MNFTSSVMLNVSCTSATLGVVSENVSLSVVDVLFTGFETMKTFDTFELLYRSVNLTDLSTQCGNVTLEGYGFGSVGSLGCVWNVSSDSALFLANVTSPLGNYSDVLSIREGKLYFDVKEVIGGFVQNQGIFHDYILSETSFISNQYFNSSYNLNKDNNLFSLNKSDTREIFYFKGNIFSTKEELEIIN